jgi:hypothetical protein
MQWKSVCLQNVTHVPFGCMMVSSEWMSDGPGADGLGLAPASVGQFGPLPFWDTFGHSTFLTLCAVSMSHQFVWERPRFAALGAGFSRREWALSVVLGQVAVCPIVPADEARFAV